MLDGAKKNFGFGCMRLLMADGEVDINERKSKTCRHFFS